MRLLCLQTAVSLVKTKTTFWPKLADFLAIIALNFVNFALYLSLSFERLNIATRHPVFDLNSNNIFIIIATGRHKVKRKKKAHVFLCL